MADRQNYSNGSAGYSGGDENTNVPPVNNLGKSGRYDGRTVNSSQNNGYYRPSGQNNGYYSPAGQNNGYCRSAGQNTGNNGAISGNPGNSYYGQQRSNGSSYSNGSGRSAGNGYSTGTGYSAGNGYSTGSGYSTGNGYSNGGTNPAGAGRSTGGQSARPRSNRMSMAARAAGTSRTEPYGRRTQQSAGQQKYRQQPVSYTAKDDYEDDYDYDDEPQRPVRRRRRHHPFRNFLIFLVILAVIVGFGYFLLFRAPNQSEADGYTRKDGFYNILLCATDEDGERTDSMMILSLDKKGKSVSLTSLPRDTLLKSGDKLNSVYINAGCGESGAEALMDTVEELLGFRPDGYAVISYQVFKDAVDAMGGVTFDVPMDMTVDYANNDDDDVFIPAGEQVLDGDTALRVVRYRYGYSMADIQRVYVQQSFLKAMIKQCMSPSKWLKLPAVYNAVMENTITDLSGAQLRYIALWAMLSYGDGINQNTLPGEGVTYNGASCYALYSYNVVDMINSYMNPYEEAITWDDVSIYSVSNGELVPDQTSGTAFDASTYDYQ